jgi:hypothetical protein
MPLLTETYVEIFPDAAEKVTNTAEARSFLAEVARQGADYAISIAPVFTGAYADSISSDVEMSEKPEAIVSAGTDHWRYLEFGSIHNRPFRVLTNALIYMTDKQELT